MLPNAAHKQIILATMNEYVRTVNECVADMVTFNEYGKLTSKNVDAQLPSALRCQCVVDAKSIFKKYRKTGIESVVKKPIAVWNNQNFFLC